LDFKHNNIEQVKISAKILLLRESNGSPYSLQKVLEVTEPLLLCFDDKLSYLQGVEQVKINDIR